MELKLIAELIIGLVIGLVAAWLLLSPTAPQAPQCPVTLDLIKKRGKLVMGTSADWPPYEYIEGEV